VDLLQYSNAAMRFGTNYTNRATYDMTLDSSGNLGIGTSSPATKLHVVGQSRVADSSNAANYMTFGVGANAPYGNASISTTTAGLSIVAEGAGSMTFLNNGSERARIDSSGFWTINERVTIGGTGGFASAGTIGFTSPDVSGAYSNATATTTVNHYRFANANGQVGSITTNGSATLYNVTSDQRLKENIVDADSASNLIDSLQVRKFDWKSDNSHQRYGFIAQELVTVAPEAVNQPADTDEMMAVDYSKLVPMLVKEIQSLRQRLSAANL